VKTEEPGSVLEEGIPPRHQLPSHVHLFIVAGLVAGVFPVGFVVAWQRSLRSRTPVGVERLKDYDHTLNSDGVLEQKTCALP